VVVWAEPVSGIHSLQFSTPKRGGSLLATGVNRWGWPLEFPARFARMFPVSRTPGRFRWKTATGDVFGGESVETIAKRHLAQRRVRRGGPFARKQTCGRV
jgi:hypothetical protein